jgi:hypothetical protein
MVEVICFAIESSHCFLGSRKTFHGRFCQTWFRKQKDVCVLQELFQCMSTITCFDLWMSKGTYDIFALVINFLNEN